MQEATRLVILDAIRREGEAADRYEREADELLARACELDDLASQARARAVIHRQALEPVRFAVDLRGIDWAVTAGLAAGIAAVRHPYDPRPRPRG